MEDVQATLKTLMAQRHYNDRYRALMQRVYQDHDVQQFLEAHKADLNADAVERGAAKLYEFCQEKAKVARHEPTLAPGYEPRLVLSNHLIDVAYAPTAQLLQEQAAAALRERVHSISMPKNIRNANLQDYDQDNNRNTALLAAYDFIDNYRENPHQFQQGLYLSGSFGVGKTFLLAAIANELAQSGFNSTLIHFPSFVVEMKRSISDNSSGAKIDSIKTAPILMLDDIGADSASAWIRDDVLGVVLEYRMQNELPTFFSSNLSMKDLETDYLTFSKQGDNEPLKADRIMQRIRFLSREIVMVGRNRRPGN